MSGLTERSPLVPSIDTIMSRPSQERTTPRSSGSYQRIKNGSKGMIIEDHLDTGLSIEGTVHTDDVTLDIHDEKIPEIHNNKEKEDPLSDMDVEEGSLKAVTRPNIKEKSASTPQYKNAWPGQNSVHYFCSKKCKVVYGPNRLLFYVTVCIAIFGSLMFYAFPGSRIWYKWNNLGKALDIIGLYIVACLLAFLFKAAYSDPGIIPRNPNWRQLFEENKWRYIAETYYQRRKRKKRKKRNVTIKGVVLNINYCGLHEAPTAEFATRVLIPLTTTVLGLCSAILFLTIIRTGNCVGKLNYRYFLLFVFCVLIACSFFATLCLVQLFEKGHPHVLHHIEEDTFVDLTFNRSPLATQLVSLVLVTLMVIVFVLVANLSFVHCKLLAKGQTTYENLKGKYDGGTNPFNEGCRNNWMKACCGPFYSSYIDVSWMEKDNK